MSKTEEELAFWRCMFSGLLINYIMRARQGSDLMDHIDFSQSDAHDRVCDVLLAAAIHSGAYAEAGLSEEAVRRILADIGAPTCFNSGKTT